MSQTTEPKPKLRLANPEFKPNPYQCNQNQYMNNNFEQPYSYGMNDNYQFNHMAFNMMGSFGNG